MFRNLMHDSKLLLYAIITIIALLVSSHSTPPATYEWKMNMKYGPATQTVNGGYVSFGWQGIPPLCKEKDNVNYP